MITKNKIDEIVNKIAINYNPYKIILFGSYASGNINESSDLDLLIIKNTNIPKHKRGRVVRKFLYGSMVPMDLIIYTEKEFEEEKKQKYSFINTAIKSSQVLYERKK